MQLIDSSRTAESPPEGTEYPGRPWLRPAESRPLESRSLRGFGPSTSSSTSVLSSVDEWMLAQDPDDFIVQPATVVHRSPAQAKFRSLQSWEGRVVEVSEDSFVATLVDLTMPGTEEHVELDLEEVTRDDRHLVIPGAVFYWSIGYREDPSGSRSRASEIRFRRLPRWSAREVADIAVRVDALKALTGIGR
jgi:hypothetical protein